MDISLLRFNAISQSIIAVITMMLDLFMIFLIATKTPTKMGAYKWFILNLAIADILTASFECVLRPVILTSNAAVMLVGPVKVLGQAYAIPMAIIFLTMMAWVIYSLFICFVYRYTNMVNNRITMMISNRFGGALAVVLGIAAFFIFAFLVWNVLERDYDLLLNSTLAAYPNLPELEPDLVLIGLSNPELQSSTAAIAAVAFGGAIIFEIAICMMAAFIVVKVRQFRNSMSTATFKLQQQLVISLAVECVYPILIGVIPVVTGASCVIFHCPAAFIVDYDWIALSFLTACFTFPAFDAIVTIGFIGPYRRAVLNYARSVYGFVTIRKRKVQSHPPIDENRQLTMTHYTAMTTIGS